jgi:hypothetical protein
MIYYLSTALGLSALYSFLESWGRPVTGRITPVDYESLVSGEARVPDGASYIFTWPTGRPVSEPARAAAVALYDRLIQANAAHRVLNSPRDVLYRFDLLRTLHERRINQFNIYRLDDRERPARFPVIIRRELGAEHNPLPVVNSTHEFEAAVRGYRWLRGTVSDLVGVEFCETADAKGVYRKFGAFVVGDRIVPRHVFFSRNWMVKLADLAEPEMIEEERDYLNRNPHADPLLECARLANIRYGRIDYAMLGDRPQIWEINMNPLIATRWSGDIPAREPAHRKFVELFADALIALDA